jgi:hypothetical protein
MSQQSKSKELKITTKHVITLDQIKSNERAIKLLYIIFRFGEITEKALMHLIKDLKEEGIDLKYNIVEIAGNPVSKELKEELTALLYVGLIESIAPSKKLNITTQGKEFIENISIDEEFKSNVDPIIEKLRSKLSSMVAEADFGLGRRRFRSR